MRAQAIQLRQIRSAGAFLNSDRMPTPPLARNVGKQPDDFQANGAFFKEPSSRGENPPMLITP